MTTETFFAPVKLQNYRALVGGVAIKLARTVAYVVELERDDAGKAHLFVRPVTPRAAEWFVAERPEDARLGETPPRGDYAHFVYAAIAKSLGLGDNWQARLPASDWSSVLTLGTAYKLA